MESSWSFIKSIFLGISSKAFRLYLPLLIYVLAFLVFFSGYLKDRKANSIKYFLLATYGLIIFYRTLTGPSYEYMGYGIVPALTLGFWFLDWQVKELKKDSYDVSPRFFIQRALVFFLCLMWLGFTLEDKRLLKFNFRGLPQS